jgi:predicted nucleic acid-binding protein
MVARVTLVELSPPVLGRAAEPFPIPARTLDALHLATVEFLRARRFEIELATYDRRMASAAAAMGIRLVTMP